MEALSGGAREGSLVEVPIAVEVLHLCGAGQSRTGIHPLNAVQSGTVEYLWN